VWATGVSDCGAKATESAASDDLGQAAQWQKRKQSYEARLVHGSFDPLGEEASEHGREVQAVLAAVR